MRDVLLILWQVPLVNDVDDSTAVSSNSDSSSVDPNPGRIRLKMGLFKQWVHDSIQSGVSLRAVEALWSRALTYLHD